MSILQSLLSLRNDVQPKSSNNLDSVQFDYHFWTDLEKVVKKQREKAKDALLKIAKKPEKIGIIINGGLYNTWHKASNPRRTFDKDVFIELVVKEFPEIPRWQLVELATRAVVDGAVSHTYTVEAKDKNDD